MNQKPKEKPGLITAEEFCDILTKILLLLGICSFIKILFFM